MAARSALDQRRRRWWPWAAMLALAAVGVWWTRPAFAPPPSAERSSASVVAARPAIAPVRKTAPSSAPGSPAVLQPPGLAGQAGLPPPAPPSVLRDQVLARYREASKYPPTSRPLGRHQDDLLHPNKRYEQPHPADDDPDTSYLFTADKYFVVGNDDVSISLQVSRKGAPAQVRVLQATLQGFEAGKGAVGQPAPLSFAGQGTLLVATLKPATALALTRTTMARAQVLFDYGGPAPQAAHLDLQVTPPSGVPAQFSGHFRHHVASGSLVVEAQVRVFQRGYFLVDCNLFGAGDQPAVWTRYKGTLEPGDTWVPLSFFGKAILDSQAQPPFHLGQLRGARFVEGQEPDMEQMPAFEGRYEIAQLEMSQLSSAEWDSPEKQAKLKALEEVSLDPLQPAPSVPAP